MVGINFNRIPDQLFFRAYMPVQYYMASITKNTPGKTLGEPVKDVKLSSPVGLHTKISRQELRESFRLINGRKIWLIQWLEGEYPVKSTRKTEYRAFPVPINTKVILGNGRTAHSDKKRRDYIVCYAGENNSVDRTLAVVMPKSTFNRLFILPEQDGVLRENASDIASELRRVGITEAIGDMTEDNKTRASRPGSPRPPKTNPSGLPVKYRLTHSVVDGQGKILGFCLRREDGLGKPYKVPMEKIVKMATAGRLLNAKMNYPKDRREYLSGINIRLDELPKIKL